MTHKYLDQLKKLIAPAVSGRFRGVNLEYRHFFSGAALYANGRICISLTPAGFALKLPEASRMVLLKQKRAKQLRYFPQAPLKREYVVLPRPMLNDVRALRRWIRISIEYAVDTASKDDNG